MKLFINRALAVVIITVYAIGVANAQKKEAYDFVVNGVKVIVQPSGNEIVEVQTIFRGGVQNYAADKAGIESLAMKALTECGTARDDKNSFKNKLDKVDAQVYGDAEMDYASFHLNCIKGDLETVWQLYVDALTTPRFDPKEFDRIKTEAINNIRETTSQPDYAIHKLAMETAFAGKNYAKDPMGTETTVFSLTSDEVAAYYKNLVQRSRMFIVFVGDLDKGEIEKKVKGLLEAIPEGRPFEHKPEILNVKANSFKMQKKELATNYIEAISNGPVAGAPDYNAYNLAMRIFYNRHFLEVRTNNGLSYAPQTYFDGGLSSFSGISVSTTDPNKYIQVLNRLVTKTKQGFTDEEVRNVKTRFITNLAARQETNSEQADALASNEVIFNNWKRAINLNEELQEITTKQVNDAFKKYLTNYSWVYQGNPAKVNPTLYTGASGSAKLPPSKFENPKEAATKKSK